MFLIRETDVSTPFYIFVFSYLSQKFSTSFIIEHRIAWILTVINRKWNTVGKGGGHLFIGPWWLVPISISRVKNHSLKSPYTETIY